MCVVTVCSCVYRWVAVRVCPDVVAVDSVVDSVCSVASVASTEGVEGSLVSAGCAVGCDCVGVVANEVEWCSMIVTDRDTCVGMCWSSECYGSDGEVGLVSSDGSVGWAYACRKADEVGSVTPGGSVVGVSVGSKVDSVSGGSMSGGGSTAGSSAGVSGGGGSVKSAN